MIVDDAAEELSSDWLRRVAHGPVAFQCNVAPVECPPLLRAWGRHGIIIEAGPRDRAALISWPGQASLYTFESERLARQEFEELHLVQTDVCSLRLYPLGCCIPTHNDPAHPRPLNVDGAAVGCSRMMLIQPSPCRADCEPVIMSQRSGSERV